MAKAKSPSNASDQENLDINLDSETTPTQENNFVLPDIDMSENTSTETEVEIPSIDISSDTIETSDLQPEIAEIDMSDIDETTETVVEIPSIEMDMPETTEETITQDIISTEIQETPVEEPIKEPEIKQEEIIEKVAVQTQEPTSQPNIQEIEPVQSMPTIESLPQVDLPTNTAPAQINEEKEEPKKANQDFFINLGPAKEEKTEDKPEDRINIKTIKIDIGTEKISDEEKTRSMQDTISILNKEEDKVDAQSNPMINVLSEISKTGLSLDEAAADNVESEIFKNVIKKNKAQKIFKVMMIMISVIGLAGTGSYFVYENKEDVMANILSIVNKQNNQNLGKKPDMSMQGNNPQNNGGNPQPNNNITPPLPNTNNEELEKIKKDHEQINNQLKTLQGQLGSKDAEIKKLNEKISAFNNTGDIIQNFLNTTYKDDYKFIKSMKIDEGQKNNYLIDINMLMIDLKSKKTSFSEFRIKYNNLINKILLAHPSDK